MNFITSQFGSLSKFNKLEKLMVDDLILILSHRKVNVASEDEVIDCLMTWFEPNIYSLSDENLTQIVNHVNWPYVSFDKLLSIFKTFPKLR